jgi:hypothetical protein
MAALSSLLGVAFRGDIGLSGTIAVGNVTTGGTASVINVGTPSAAILDFNLPIGTFDWPSPGVAVSNGSAWTTSLSYGSASTANSLVQRDSTNSFSANTITANTVNSTFLGTWSGTAISPARGGTGLTSPGTSGNVLTSNGSSWVSQAPAVTTGKAIAMAIVFG